MISSLISLHQASWTDNEDVLPDVNQTQFRVTLARLEKHKSLTQLDKHTNLNSTSFFDRLFSISHFVFYQHTHDLTVWVLRVSSKHPLACLPFIAAYNLSNICIYRHKKNKMNSLLKGLTRSTDIKSGVKLVKYSLVLACTTRTAK